MSVTFPYLGGRYRHITLPTDILGSPLKAWWDADDWGNASLVTDDGSGLISSWKDRVGSMALTEMIEWEA